MKRTFDAKIRKVGNSFVITIPIETIERFKFKEGDVLALSIDSDDVQRVKESNGDKK